MYITNIRSHLKSRGVDFNRTPVILDEINNYAVFLMYNFSGQLVGYQNYNPNADKNFNQGCSEAKHRTYNDLREMMRYYSYNTKNGKVNEHSVWGLETLSLNDKYVFLTEGIFDIIKIHNQGLPGLAIMGHDPKHLRVWLEMLPQKKIVIYDDDKGGRKLIKYGDLAYTVPEPFHDLGDMSDIEVFEFLKTIPYN